MSTHRQIPPHAALAPRAAFFLLSASLAACADAPTAPDRSGDEAASPTALATVPAPQASAIAALVEAAESAWAANDPAAYADIFGPEVEFVSPYGTYLHGRAAVRAQHVLLFGGPFVGSHLDITIGRIEPLTGTMALVDLTYEIRDFPFLSPGLRETEPGVLRLTVRWLVVRSGEHWWSVAHQMTPVLPAPSPPPAS